MKHITNNPLFSKLVAVDNTGLTQEIQTSISEIVETAIFYTDDPTSPEAVIERAQGAEAILVSWRTPITGEIMAKLPNLKYVGMCCSLYDESSANVDIAYARAHGIAVRGVRDYGDEGLVEYILHSLIGLYHGFYEPRYQWSPVQEELTDKVLGIVGFGTTGQMLAQRALAFGMRVVYYSRTRRPELENEHISYLPLEALMAEAHIISTHLPKNTVILGERELSLTKDRAVLVNTSLEPTFDLQAFDQWITRPHHFAIFDGGGLGKAASTLVEYPNVLATKKVTGFTSHASVRLSQKVLANLLACK